MAKTRAIVKRRKAIRNIRKITRTMELIATARFKKALDRATEADAYTRKIAELAADLSASATNISHPLLQTRPEVKSSLLLVITSNRGLCGGYNASLIREASARVRQIKGLRFIWSFPASERSRTFASKELTRMKNSLTSKTSLSTRKWRSSRTGISKAISPADMIASKSFT